MSARVLMKEGRKKVSTRVLKKEGRKKKEKKRSKRRKCGKFSETKLSRRNK